MDARGEPDRHQAFPPQRAGRGSCCIGGAGRRPAGPRSITKAPWGDIAWKNIVAAQSERGEVEAALQTADQIRSGYEKGEALKAVVAALVRANDLAKVRRVADSIAKGFWQIEAMLEIARGKPVRAGVKKSWR